MDKPTLTLSNCKFAFPCTKSWETLQKTADESVRYCDTCEHSVYLCSTDEELTEATRQNRCVAIKLTDVDKSDRDGYTIGAIQTPPYVTGRDL